MKLSVVIPLYNKAQSIIHTLDSVLAQSYTDYEVVIVNDGSSDLSQSVVEEYIKFLNGDKLKSFSLENGKIKLINQPNGGVSSARNRGIQEAQGEYVLFLDADDLWDEDYLAEQVRMISDFPEAMMWGTNFAEVTNGNQLVRELATGLPNNYRGYVNNYFELPGRVSDLFHSSAVAIRKEVFETIGYFDERIKIAEDIDMWWRIIAVYPVAFYDKYMVYYQQDAENRALQKNIPLNVYLPYFVDKYKAPIFKNNATFYRYAMLWTANTLKRYMENPETRREAMSVGRHLDISVLPTKYTLIFGLPTILGYWIYKFTTIIHIHK